MPFQNLALCAATVFATGVVSVAVAVSFELSGRGYVCEDDLWKPCWRNVRPRWLLAVRVISFLYLLSILIYDFLLNGPSIYEYYTEWSFTLLIAYFALATVVSSKHLSFENSSLDASFPGDSIRFLVHSSEKDEKNRLPTLQVHSRGCEPERQEAGTVGYVMQIIFQTVTGAVVLTDLIYWTLLHSNFKESGDFVSVNMHGVNLVFLVVDIVVNNLSFPWFRGSYFLLWSGLFSVFTWIIHAFGETIWPYPFLDVSVKWSPLWYFGLFVGHIVVYSIVCLIMYVKKLCVEYNFKSHIGMKHSCIGKYRGASKASY
eukprot:c26520_g1_i1 orf=219-1163(-)